MLKSTTRPLSEAYQLALLDLDGVVYRGKNPVEHAAESIRKAEGLGMTVEYTTNNSSRLQSVVADQLKGFDLDVEPWHHLVRGGCPHGGPCGAARCESVCARRTASA